MPLTSAIAYIESPAMQGSTLPEDGIVEYSRNEPGREIINLWVLPTPNDGTIAGSDITIRLMKARRDRSEEVVQARRAYTFSGPVGAGGAQFQFNLQEIVYSAAKPFPVVRRGMYFFAVTYPIVGGTAIATTVDFRVCPITVEKMETTWLIGATRRSNDDRMVRFQPIDIPGVMVLEISRNHPLDMFPLTLQQNGATTPASPSWFLSWRNGRQKKVDMSLPSGLRRQYTLPADTGEEYIIVQVDPRILPTVDTTEELIVDRQLIPRATLRALLDQEADWLEQHFIHTPIEPALVVSDYTLSTLSATSGSGNAPALPENTDYDLMGNPVTYFPPSPGHFLNLRLPYGHVLAFEYLVGAVGASRVVDVNTDWIQPGANAFTNLLPYNQSLAYHFIGLMHVHALRGPVELGSFWRYRYWAGIGDRVTPTNIIACIGLRASVTALAILGQMYRGGFSSQSVSRDGISESASYTASAQFGIYSASVEEYKKRLEDLEKQIKGKYFGVFLGVL